MKKLVLSKKLFLILFHVLISNCNVIKTIDNISRLKFNIKNVENIKILDIKLDRKKSLNDFNSIELSKLSSALSKETFPIEFTINVEATNPSEGNSEIQNNDVTISSFPYRIIINEKEIMTGNIDKEIIVPSKGNSIIIPLSASIDLFSIVKEKKINDVINFFPSLGELNNDKIKIKIIAKPTLKTQFGEITYPKEILILSKEFN